MFRVQIVKIFSVKTEYFVFVIEQIYIWLKVLSSINRVQKSSNEQAYRANRT